MRISSSLSILLFVILSHIPHGAAGQIAFTLRDQPQLYYGLEWSPTLSRWDSSARYISTYDADGRMTSTEHEFRHFTGYWQKSTRTEIRRTAQPDSLLHIAYSWNPAGWSNYYQNIWVYDSKGRLTEMHYYEGGSNWTLRDGSRYTYDENGAGNITRILTEVYDDQTSAWDTTEMASYLYGSGGTAHTIRYSLYSNGQWTPSHQDINIQWHDFNLRQASQYDRQQWINNQYVNSDKVDCVYGAFGYRRCSTDRWDGTIWQPFIREKDLQDAYGHTTDSGREHFDGTNWVIDEWTTIDHTYNGDHLVESIVRPYDFQTQQSSTENQYKYVFMDYAVEVAPPADLSPLIAFPQPATDRLYVRADLRGPLRLHVYDLQGRLLLTQDSDADRLQASGIDLSQVPNGLYLLQIEAARTHHTLRIQVQH
jgi:hypothetical protein